MTTSALVNATGPRTNQTLKDGSRRIVYNNGTIARFYGNNSLMMLEVPPKAFYFNLNQNSDGSSFFDFSQAN
jgi:hypothetical protein